MDLAINGSTTGDRTLEEDLAIAAEAGYVAVELRMPKVDAFLEKNTFADLRALLEKHSLRVFTINSIENATLRDEAGTTAIHAEVEKFAAYAAELSCPWLIICPGICPDDTPWDDIVTRSGRDLAAIADIALRQRVGVAFEFLRIQGSSVKTPSPARA
ncbi:MAG: sugar phosphate isomerase/epimerase, partial [Planctomycetes bacterium]|nr:sugar phosphate isomerase/epimerase [Planctomycetota bacterium]